MNRKVAAAVISASLALSGCAIFKGSGKKDTPTLGSRVPILGTERDSEIDPALASVPVIIPEAVANNGWPQPGGNAAKAMGHLALGTGLSVAWTAQIDGGSNRAKLAAAPVVDGGRLYVVDTAARVHAFDAATGARRWSASVAGEGGRTSLFGGGVSSEGDTVYATNGVGDVTALKAADGAKVWTKRPAGPLRGSPTLSNGNLYVMTQDNQVYAMSAADGSAQWNASGSVGQAGIFGVAAPSAGQGTVIVGYSTGELSAYRYENGRELWSDALSRTSISTTVSSLTDIDADPVIDRGRVFAVGQGGRMAAYELVTGQRAWEINIASIATPAVAGDWVFVLTDDAKLLCVARSNGKIRWISQLQQYRGNKAKKGAVDWTGPVLAGGRLIAASSEGEIWSVAPADGAATRIGKVGSGVSLPPVVAGGMLYVLDDGGRITAWR